MNRRWPTVALASTLYLVSQQFAGAQESEQQYFEGKTINIIVPYSPGGGYDLYARMIAPYLKKYMHANTVVQNKPGAGGITALNAMTMTPPDGLQLALINGNGAAIAQILQEPGVRYDLSKFDYLGGVGIAPDVWLFTPKLSVTSVAQVIELKQTIRWGATGKTDILSVGAAITCQTFQIKCRVIIGYPGAANVVLALARDEVDAMIISEGAAANYVKNGSARALATMSKKRSRFLPDTPTIYEVADLSEDGRWWLTFRSNIDALNKVLIAPPGMPEARLAYLRSVMKQALMDPALIADGESSQRIVEYQDPESVKQAVLAITSKFPESEKEKIREVIRSSFVQH